NDGGGKKKASDFATVVSGNNPDPSTFPGNSKGTTVTIEPGKYSVSQKKSSGYSVTKSSSCSGNIKSGETNVCVITNTYSASKVGGTLEVITKVKNNDIGTKKSSDFTITVYGNDPKPSTFPGSSKGVSVNLIKGSYSVAVDGPSDYSTSYSSKCLGTMTSGAQITCTITSEYNPDYKPGTLIVITDVVNNNNADDEDTKKVKPSAFTIKVKGNNPSPKSFPGRSGDGISVSLYPGKYSVSEKGPNGYDTSFSKNCEGKIKAGEVKVCNISNSAIPLKPIIPQTKLSVIDTITGFSTPSGVTFNPDNELMYVSNSGQINTLGTVAVINSTTRSYESVIPVGVYPQSIVYNSANDLIYTSNTLSNKISVINATSNLVIDTIPTGTSSSSSLTAISVNSINNTLYLANSADNSVSVINGTSNIVYYNITQATGNFFTPSSVAYNYENDYVYVANRGSDKISVLNSTTHTLIDEISTMGIAPSEIIYNNINDNIYVANMGSNSVSIINGTTNTVIDTVLTGSRPTGMTFSQNTGDVYITNLLDGNISIIDGFTNDLVTNVPLSINSNPAGISYNDFEEELYVANINSGTVSVIGYK
ncbi:MAG: YncE family protein, partial [Nitrososphaeraceae archaeon]